MDTVYLTPKGLDKLRNDLNHLMKVVRPEAAQELATAREKGDLSENAEYDAAREKLTSIDRQIASLYSKLSNVQILEGDNRAHSEVRILSQVLMKNMKNGKEIEYILVDPIQAEPAKMLISVKSPIAKGLLGKSVGDEVVINIPSGAVTFRILEIKASEGL